MNTESEPPAPGGFLLPTLPSPPPSSITSPSNPASTLPVPRVHPLKPNSSKESSFIDYVDRKLLEISGRYEKRFNKSNGEQIDGNGYERFGEVAKDLESIFDIVWVSGTPSLQKPYLLNIAHAVTTYLPSFPFAPRSSFQLLHKLDIALSSLLHGQNVETGETLPGFEGGRGTLTTTDKVRLRGIVERTRVVVVGVASKDSTVDDAPKVIETDADDEDHNYEDEMESLVGDSMDDDCGRWEMEIARVYARTIVDIGAALEFLESSNWTRPA